MMSEGVMTETFRLVMRHAERKQDIDLLGRLKRYAEQIDLEAWNTTERTGKEDSDAFYGESAHEDSQSC